MKSLRILFIDDDVGAREVVRELLELKGAFVELAASSAEGMAAVDTFDPQVILCDITMPEENGYTFMRKLRAREAAAGRPRVPALAFTALNTPDDRRRALAAGFQLHVPKPIDIERLRAAVKELATMIPSAG